MGKSRVIASFPSPDGKFVVDIGTANLPRFRLQKRHIQYYQPTHTYNEMLERIETIEVDPGVSKAYPVSYHFEAGPNGIVNIVGETVVHGAHNIVVSEKVSMPEDAFARAVNRSIIQNDLEVEDDPAIQEMEMLLDDKLIENAGITYGNHIITGHVFHGIGIILMNGLPVSVFTSLQCSSMGFIRLADVYGIVDINQLVERGEEVTVCLLTKSGRKGISYKAPVSLENFDDDDEEFEYHIDGESKLWTMSKQRGGFIEEVLGSNTKLMDKMQDAISNEDGLTEEICKSFIHEMHFEDEALAMANAIDL